MKILVSNRKVSFGMDQDSESRSILWTTFSLDFHYRFHREAPIRFRKAIKATIEDGEERIVKFMTGGEPGQDKKMK